MLARCTPIGARGAFSGVMLGDARYNPAVVSATPEGGPWLARCGGVLFGSDQTQPGHTMVFDVFGRRATVVRSEDQ